MNTYIVDASIAAKWFINEEFSDDALSVLSRDNQLHAPDFLMLEMDSILSKWIRRKSITAAEGSDLRDSLRQYPIRLYPFITYLDSAFVIATATKQSVYDCLYIALAVLLNGKMVTADRKLYDGIQHRTYKKHLLWIENIAKKGLSAEN